MATSEKNGVAASRLRTRLEQIHHCKRTLLNLFVINLTICSYNAGGKCFWAHADRRKTYVAEQGHQTRIASISDQELPERLDGHAILVKILKRNACIYFDLLGNILRATSESPSIEFEDCGFTPHCITSFESSVGKYFISQTELFLLLFNHAFYWRTSKPITIFIHCLLSMQTLDIYNFLYIAGCFEAFK